VASIATSVKLLGVGVGFLLLFRLAFAAVRSQS
jgi:hypothetical protein